jgi:hypothetical protein
MKRLAVLTLFLLLTARSQAQTSGYEVQQGTPVEEKMIGNETVVMKDGKVWYMKAGNKILVTENVSLGSSRIDARGKVTLKDGTTTQLKEGDSVRSDGTVVRARNNKEVNNPKEDSENK